MAEPQVHLTIDGRDLAAEAGERILDCALRNGIQIPHLCNHPSLPPFGACRMCMVEVEGMRGYPTSCTTPVTEGMKVQTDTPALRKFRRNILALTMLEHPNACLVCGKRELCEQYRPHAEKVGNTTGCHTCNNMEVCEVRVMSKELDLKDLPVAPIYRHKPIERMNPFIDRDLNLCILCGRCVRICKHHQGRSVIDFIGRSSDTHIGEAFDRDLRKAGCTFCGSCIDVCPTGTLSDRFAKWYGKHDTTTESTCTFCGAACALALGSREGKLVASAASQHDQPICVLGRFGVPEFLNGNDRLHMPHVRITEQLRELEWPEALEKLAEKLKAYSGGSFALVCDTTSTLEARAALKKFTNEVMQSSHYIEIEPDERGVSKVALPAGVKAALLTGHFIDTAELDSLELLAVVDCYPSPATERAYAVLPAAVFAEAEGTILDDTGMPRPVHKACEAPGKAKPEAWIASQLAEAMGTESFGWDGVAAITESLALGESSLRSPGDAAPAPALDARLARSHYRGHRLAERILGLRALAPSEDAGVPQETDTGEAKGGFRVLSRREVAPNAHELVIEARNVAKKAQAGQFVIVMVDETAERVPYTLCGWDAEAGTITLVVQEKGQSSRKLVMLEAGDHIRHVVGPLGIPLEIKNYGTVALAGGCYGIGAIVPIATAMKAAGNHVISIAEARSHYMAYYREKLEGLSDEFVQTTVDGSLDEKGHAVDVIGARLKSGEKIDFVVAVGCPFMMMLTSNETKPYGVKTMAALNPIMVDGTGMCGACRLSVGEETKFACVDGPFFDAHLVDWDEVRDRREAYSNEEIQSLGRTDPVTVLHDHAHADGHACTCTQ